jgi:hypothetical protein
MFKNFNPETMITLTIVILIMVVKKMVGYVLSMIK